MLNKMSRIASQIKITKQIKKEATSQTKKVKHIEQEEQSNKLNKRNETIGQTRGT